ncbi:Por secretion system C-terminal sorting domain-containing protein [Chitinophaga sp. YR573]|nr:Por secretion system C-terminal sorting domain-containing protein [Chitinophaga sp. YR573]
MIMKNAVIIVIAGMLSILYTTKVYGQLSGPTNLYVCVDFGWSSSGSVSLSSGEYMGGTSFRPSTGTGVVYVGSVASIPTFWLLLNNNVSTASEQFNTTDIYPVSSGLTGPTIPFYGELKQWSSDKNVRFVYEMPAPNTLTVTSPASSGQFCSNQVIILNSNGNWPIMNDLYVTQHVIMEYNISGSSAWKVIDSVGYSYYSGFYPENVIPEIQSTQQNVRFRCKQKAVYADATYYSPYSTPTAYYTIFPPPPNVDQSKIVITPACYGQSNGKITIQGSDISAGYANMRWILRPGSTSSPCDPGLSVGSSNCGDIVDWSDGVKPVSDGVNATNIAPGTYSLWLVSPGGTIGNCIRAFTVTVPQLTELSISNNTAQTTNVSCYGGSNGNIGVTAAGGDGSSTGYYFTLNTSGGTTVSAEQHIASANMLWQNLPAGDYVIQVRDGTCSVIKTLSVTLTQPAQITGAVTSVNPTCANPGNGSIGVTANGTAVNYTYNLYQGAVLAKTSGLTTANNYTFNDLADGNYTVEIINADYASCAGWTTTGTLTAASMLSLQLTARDSVSCNGGNDGRLAFSGTGGSGSYQYTIGAVTNTTGEFTGLSAGDYTVSLKNQGTGCNDEVVQTFTVFQRAPLQVSLQKTDITCNGANNAILKAVVTGGSADYKYTWQQYKAGAWVGNSFWFSTDNTIEALEPGTYRVIITDNKSVACTVISAQVTFTDPASVNISDVIVHDAVCLADGASISITATGGDGNLSYAYSTDGGSSFTGFTAATALYTNGDYTLKVTDGNNCAATTSTTYKVTLPAAALDFTTQLSNYNGFNISCFGAGDGSITITPTGGNGGAYSGYQYKLNSGVYQTSNVFDHLTAGTYVVSVKDGRGCVVTHTIALKQPAIMISAVKTDIDCYGSSTGTIITSINGGAAPYSFTLNGRSVPVNQLISGLSQGDYTLHISDANGCTKDSTINIAYTYPQLNAVGLVLSDIQCYGSTGSVTLNANGGDGIYTYTITNNSWATQATYTSGSSLAAGDYQFRVTDGHGCKADYTNTTHITAPSAPVTFTAVLSDYNGYNISCFGGNNGYAVITPAGGNGSTYSGYTYALDNGAFSNNATIQLINAGDHILKVQDARGCIAQGTYTFIQSSAVLDISLVSKQDVQCAIDPNGKLTVAGNGGVGNLLYSIDGNNWQSSPVFGNLTAGDYTVSVKDVNACSKALTVTISSLNPPIVVDNITLNDIICYGTKGSLTVVSHGGSGTLSNEYSLNGTDYTAFNSSTQLDAGVYRIRIKDDAGCYSSVSDPVSITAPAAPLSNTITTSAYNGVQVSCYGQTDGSLSFATSGGTSGYEYNVNNTGYTTNNNFTGLPAGTYTIKVKDARGCVLNESVILQQPDLLALTVTGTQDLTCGANPTGKITLSAAGGTIPYTYSIDGDSWQSQPVFNALTAGGYTLLAKDANGCAVQTTATLNTQYPAIVVVDDITPVSCFGEANGAIRVTVTGGDGNYQYEWNTPDPLKVAAGDYTLKITDGTNCTSSFIYTVTQPNQLQLQYSAPAICDGLTEGIITATATGGTLPYTYAVDNSGLQSGNTFNALDKGNHTLTVQDANNCKVTQDVNIATVNTKPEVNFLVASRKNALDTLIVKEISVPAPDEVTWDYDPRATFLGYDDGMPLLKFSQAGTYKISMTGQFGQCTYSLEKDVTIADYDPLAGPSYVLPVHVIDTVLLSPNPNDGNFQFKIKMNRKQQAIVWVYDVNGRIVDKRQYAPSLQISDQFSLANEISNTYILRVITESESRDVRFIISR